jgi:hypothetical protein
MSVTLETMSYHMVVFNANTTAGVIVDSIYFGFSLAVIPVWLSHSQATSSMARQSVEPLDNIE